jgi:hypothetical protein
MALLFAAEGDQMLGMTDVAAHSQEPVLKAAALEVILELLLHIPRQDRALRRQVGLERGIIFLDKLIKEGALIDAAGRCWARGQSLLRTAGFFRALVRSPAQCPPERARG